MKTKRHNMWLNQSLTALCAAVMLLGLTTGSVLAVEVSDEDYKDAPGSQKESSREAVATAPEAGAGRTRGQPTPQPRRGGHQPSNGGI